MTEPLSEIEELTSEIREARYLVATGADSLLSEDYKTRMRTKAIAIIDKTIDRLAKLEKLARVAANCRNRMTLWSSGMATTGSPQAAIESLDFDNALKALDLGPLTKDIDDYYLKLGNEAKCPVCKDSYINAPKHLYNDVWMHTFCHETLG